MFTIGGPQTARECTIVTLLTSGRVCLFLCGRGFESVDCLRPFLRSPLYQITVRIYMQTYFDTVLNDTMHEYLMVPQSHTKRTSTPYQALSQKFLADKGKAWAHALMRS